MKLIHMIRDLSIFLLLLAAPCLLGAQAPEMSSHVIDHTPLPAAAAALETRGIVEELKAEDFEALRSRFDEAMKNELPDTRLRESWASLLVTAGKLKSCGEPRTSLAEEHTLAFADCAFERQEVELKLTFHPDGRLAGMFLEPKAAPRPAWTAPAYVTAGAFRERQVTIGSGLVSLPGTLAMPEGDGPFPGVVLVHGSGPHDRDETIGGLRPFQDLAQGLASRGIAVLRYEKRTKVYQEELAGTRDMTVKEEVIDDALAAVKLLRATPGIDRRRVFVAGHSLGAFLAPRIGVLDGALAGVILLAGPSRPMSEVVHDQAQWLLAPEASEVQRLAAPGVEAEAKALADLYAGQPGPASGMILGASVSYWLDLKSQVPVVSARSLGRPILILQGERDYQVTMADFAGWKKALEGRAGVTLKSYPKLNHLFASGEGRSSPAEYEKPGHVAAEVIEDVAAFVKKSPPVAVPAP